MDPHFCGSYVWSLLVVSLGTLDIAALKTKLNWTEWCNMKGRWYFIPIIPFVWILGILISLCTVWILSDQTWNIDSRSGFESNQHFLAVSQIWEFHPAGSLGSTVQSGVTELSTILRQGKHVLMDQERNLFNLCFAMLMCFVFFFVFLHQAGLHATRT